MFLELRRRSKQRSPQCRFLTAVPNSERFLMAVHYFEVVVLMCVPRAEKVVVVYVGLATRDVIAISMKRDICPTSVSHRLCLPMLLHFSQVHVLKPVPPKHNPNRLCNLMRFRFRDCREYTRLSRSRVGRFSPARPLPTNGKFNGWPLHSTRLSARACVRHATSAQHPRKPCC